MTEAEIQSAVDAAGIYQTSDYDRQTIASHIALFRRSNRWTGAIRVLVPIELEQMARTLSVDFGFSSYKRGDGRDAGFKGVRFDPWYCKYGMIILQRLVEPPAMEESPADEDPEEG